jgi:hypothetical protein
MKILNRLLISVMLFASVCTMQAEVKAHYDGSRIFWDDSTRHTIFSHGSYPRILQLKDGRLMAVTECDGILVSCSANLGASWSPAVKIASNSNATPNCVPDLIQLADGTIIVAYNPRPSMPYTEDRRFGIRCRCSTDNGQTWSQEIFVYDGGHTFGDGCWEPSMLELPSGELHLYFADESPYTRSNEQQISLCRSFDGGLSWGQPERISFRSGFRDGMPVPLLLDEELVVIIEDNGWPGVGDFFPTTIRCLLSQNWHDHWVDAQSAQREKTLDPEYCSASVKGGAPYLRQFPWGESIISFQSDYNHPGKPRMLTAIGDSEARHFRALSAPFITAQTDEVLWNSVAVIDTGIVVATGTVNGVIEMVKGYPVRQLQAAYGHPTIDGRLANGETYTKPKARQVILGSQTGVRTSADWAYDEENLYFTARVSDRTVFTDGSQPDGVRLMLDVADASDTRPQQGVFCLFFRRDGGLSTWEGGAGSWKVVAMPDILVRVQSATTQYVVEAAIPWSSLGFATPPKDKRMAVSIETQDRRSNTMVTERIPDARLDESWTWMEFHLLDEKASSAINRIMDNRPEWDETATFPAWLSGMPLTIVREHNPDGSIRTRKILQMQ